MKPLARIFSIVPDCHADSGYYRLLWERHFYEGIRSVAGRLVTPQGVDFSWARQAPFQAVADTGAARAETSQKLWDQIQRARQEGGLDAVISYCFAQDLDPGLVRDTIRLGIPWVNFFCDSTHMFSRIEPLARVVSLNWFPESAARARYLALGVPVLHRPYAFNPDFLTDATARPDAERVAFMGLPSANRITQLGWLRVLGCPVEVRGRGWVGEGENPFYNAEPARRRALKALFQRGAGEKLLRRLMWPLVRPQARGAVPDAEAPDFLRGSRVVLGLNQARDERGVATSYLKFRDLEFPGYGCCYLTQYSEDLASALEPGVEVLAFGGLPEAAALIKRYRRDRPAAARIGANGRRRVLAEHTWAARLGQLATALG